MILTTHPLSVLRLRIGAIPPLPLYYLQACSETTLTFYRCKKEGLSLKTAFFM
jgi:hypothetical protein